MAKFRYFSFEVVIEKEPDDPGYYARCPNLPGCYSNGATIEETRKNIRQSIELHLESLDRRKQKIDSRERLVHVEEICIGLPA